MSYTYDEGVLAAIRETDRRRNTRTLIIALIIIIIIVVAAVLLYLVFKLRANAATAAANASASGSTTTKCTSSIQCSNPTPACNLSSGTCVQCTSGDDVACTGSTPHCKTSGNVCVRCNVDADCSTCQGCASNTCQAVSPTAPIITSAQYVGTDTLAVTWTATPTATGYLIDFIDATNPTPTCINSMCQQTRPASPTSYTVPPGQAACAPGAGSHVFVTAVTPCGNVVSPGYLLNGQGC